MIGRYIVERQVVDSEAMFEKILMHSHREKIVP